MKNRFRTGLIAALCLCAGLLNAQALRTCSGEADERELVGINEADTCAVPEMFLFCKSVRFFCEYQEKSVSLQTIKRKYGNNL